MTSISSIARHAFNIVGPKDDFLTAIKTKQKSSGTLSEGDRSRIVSKFSQCTLRNGDIKLARTLLDTAQKQVSGMAQSNAQRSLQTVLNHCKNLTTLAENAGGAKPEHHLDASLASTRARLIQKDMSLAEAFACKLENKEVSFRTKDLLQSIFLAEVKRPDYASRHLAFNSELGAIVQSVLAMKDSPAQSDLLKLALGFQSRVQQFESERVQSMPPRNNGPSPAQPMTPPFGFLDHAQPHQPDDLASEHSDSEASSRRSSVAGDADGLHRGRLSSGSTSSFTSFQPDRPKSVRAYEHSSDGDDTSIASSRSAASVEAPTQRDVPDNEDTQLSLRDVIAWKFSEDVLSDEWKDKIDQVFRERCQIFDYYDASKPVDMRLLLGNPDMPGFVNLSDAAAIIEDLNDRLTDLPESDAKDTLEEKVTLWSNTIEFVRGWWDQQINSAAANTKLTSGQLNQLATGAKWVGASPDQVSEHVDAMQPSRTYVPDYIQLEPSAHPETVESQA